jgi:hypothetical protein
MHDWAATLREGRQMANVEPLMILRQGAVGWKPVAVGTVQPRYADQHGLQNHEDTPLLGIRCSKRRFIPPPSAGPRAWPAAAFSSSRSTHRP